MDPVEDRDLYYIAKEGLVAPLPEPWYLNNYNTGSHVKAEMEKYIT